MRVHRGDLPSAEFLSLATHTRDQLEDAMQHGQTPAEELLVGTEYRGMNLGAVARWLGIRKFFKGFCRTAKGDVYGYNRRARQNGPGEIWLARYTGGAWKRFGYYRVVALDRRTRDNAYPNALLLDYGQGRNGRFDVTGALRDYLVRVNRDCDDLLLGKAFLAIGGSRFQVGYFLLERRGTTDEECAPRGKQ